MRAVSRFEVVPSALLRVADAVEAFGLAGRAPYGPPADLDLGAAELDAALGEFSSAQRRRAEDLADAARRTAGSLRASAELYGDVEALVVPGRRQ